MVLPAVVQRAMTPTRQNQSNIDDTQRNVVQPTNTQQSTMYPDRLTQVTTPTATPFTKYFTTTTTKTTGGGGGGGTSMPISSQTNITPSATTGQTMQSVTAESRTLNQQAFQRQTTTQQLQQEQKMFGGGTYSPIGSGQQSFLKRTFGVENLKAVSSYGKRMSEGIVFLNEDNSKGVGGYFRGAFQTAINLNPVILGTQAIGLGLYKGSEEILSPGLNIPYELQEENRNLGFPKTAAEAGAFTVGVPASLIGAKGLISFKSTSTSISALKEVKTDMPGTQKYTGTIKTISVTEGGKIYSTKAPADFYSIPGGEKTPSSTIMVSPKTITKEIMNFNLFDNKPPRYSPVTKTGMGASGSFAFKLPEDTTYVNIKKETAVTFGKNEYIGKTKSFFQPDIKVSKGAVSYDTFISKTYPDITKSFDVMMTKTATSRGLTLLQKSTMKDFDLFEVSGKGQRLKFDKRLNAPLISASKSFGETITKSLSKTSSFTPLYVPTKAKTKSLMIPKTSLISQKKEPLISSVNIFNTKTVQTIFPKTTTVNSMTGFLGRTSPMISTIPIMEEIKLPKSLTKPENIFKGFQYKNQGLNMFASGTFGFPNMFSGFQEYGTPKRRKKGKRIKGKILPSLTAQVFNIKGSLPKGGMYGITPFQLRKIPF